MSRSKQGEQRERKAPFRVKTEAAMQAQAEAEKIELSRLTSERLKTAEVAAKKSADDKLPLPNGGGAGTAAAGGGGQAPVLAGKGKKKEEAQVGEDEADEQVGKSVAGRKKMQTVEKTEAEALEDEQEAEKSAATVELAGILKRGPSKYNPPISISAFTH